MAGGIERARSEVVNLEGLTALFPLGQDGLAGR